MYRRKACGKFCQTRVLLSVYPSFWWTVGTTQILQMWTMIGRCPKPTTKCQELLGQCHSLQEVCQQKEHFSWKTTTKLGVMPEDIRWFAETCKHNQEKTLQTYEWKNVFSLLLHMGVHCKVYIAKIKTADIWKLQRFCRHLSDFAQSCVT